MKIICISKRWQDLSKKTLDATGYTNVSFDVLKVGSEYIVYGMRVDCGVAHYLLTIYPSDTWPSWYPSDFFKIIDPLVYNEWYCHVYYDQEDLNVIWGYKELFSPIHLSGLLERESEDVAIFEKRKQEIDEWEALSSYIPKKSSSYCDAPAPKSRVYTDEPVDQRICPETFVQFLEKYLQGRISSQKFAQQFDKFYRQRINFDNLDNAQTLAIKKLITIADDYAPDLINPVRKYSSEEELKDAAKKALDCVKTSEYLSSVESKY